jgi:hypothetical protein
MADAVVTSTLNDVQGNVSDSDATLSPAGSMAKATRPGAAPSGTALQQVKDAPTQSGKPAGSDGVSSDIIAANAIADEMVTGTLQQIQGDVTDSEATFGASRLASKADTVLGGTAVPDAITPPQTSVPAGSNVTPAKTSMVAGSDAAVSGTAATAVDDKLATGLKVQPEEPRPDSRESLSSDAANMADALVTRTLLETEGNMTPTGSATPFDAASEVAAAQVSAYLAANPDGTFNVTYQPISHTPIPASVVFGPPPIPEKEPSSCAESLAFGVIDQTIDEVTSDISHSDDPADTSAPQSARFFGGLGAHDGQTDENVGGVRGRCSGNGR